MRLTELKQEVSKKLTDQKRRTILFVTNRELARACDRLVCIVRATY